MRDMFPGFYRPTEAEFDQLWEEGLIAFDASVLLNLYRYSEDTREKFFDILEGLEDQIWLPHQAALEFHRNRPNVIREQEVKFEKLTSKLRELRSEAQEEIDDVLQEGRHPVLDPEELRARIKGALDELRETVEQLEEDYPNLLDEDPIRDRIDEIFEESVGDQYEEERLDDIRERGRERYGDDIPPGYEDMDKDENQYGDLILWFQVIEKAEDGEDAVILVTDDRKEDWWRQVKGQTIGPRAELVEEMREKAEALFYLYSPTRFMSAARDRLEQEVAEETLDEVERVGEQVRARAEQFHELNRQVKQLADQIRPSAREMTAALEETYPSRAELAKSLDNLHSVLHQPGIQQLMETQRKLEQVRSEKIGTGLTSADLHRLFTTRSAGEGEHDDTDEDETEGDER